VNWQDPSHWCDTAPQPAAMRLLSPDCTSPCIVSSSSLHASSPVHAQHFHTPRLLETCLCWVAGSAAEVCKLAKQGCWWCFLAAEFSTWRTDTDDSASWTSKRRSRWMPISAAGQLASICRYTEIDKILQHQQDHALPTHIISSHIKTRNLRYNKIKLVCLSFQ